MNNTTIIELSIVIGALNEEDRVGKTLGKLAAFLKSNHMLHSTEVVVVTAEAHDATHSIVSKAIKQFKHSQHIKPGIKVGKGRDVAYGMLSAKGKICLFMDADIATPLNYILLLLPIMKYYPNDLVIGSRDLKSIHTGVRMAVSLMGNAAFKIGTGLYIHDTQCGFKAMSRKNARKLFGALTITGWGFDMELIAIARANNIQIRGLSIPDWKDVPNGQLVTKKSSFIKTLIGTLRELAVVTYRYRTGKYKALRS
ncbi:MAG: glycosyltransferase [Candidatus Saccharimonadales bacterium]